MKPLNINSEEINVIKGILRRRLCGMDVASRIFGFQEERGQLYSVVSRTVTHSEGNSVLVIGPRGSGKSLLLKSILEELKSKHVAEENYIEVYLNGLIHTDDRISLKSITQQMKLENVVGDRIFAPRTGPADKSIILNVRSLCENLQFLLDSLKSGDKGSKAVLFLLDEFDLFSQHKNQTLLYNLFDVAQSAQTPVCVVGLTARMDVTELLEKRVKSRFSHRQIQLFQSFSFSEYCHIFSEFLSVSEKDCKELKKSLLAAWNEHVKLIAEEPAVIEALKKQYNLDTSIQLLKNFLLLPVCKLESSRPCLDVTEFINSYRLLHGTDSKSAILNGVSVLELSLIIAMKHLYEIYDSEPFNFEMVYREYQKFCQRRCASLLFDKCIVLKAFEHLCSLELIRPVTEGSAMLKSQKEYRLMNLLVDTSEITEVVHKYSNCPTELKQWALSSFNASS